MALRRNVRILSATGVKDSYFKGSYVEKVGKLGEQVRTYNDTIPAHPDLRNAMQKLRPHAIALAEVYDAEGPVKEDKIFIHGFTIAGENEKEGITISFVRILDNGKEVSINTPFQKWDDQNTPYDGAGELSLLIEDLKAEVYAYLFEGKHQPNMQQELPFGDDAGAAANAGPIGGDI